MTYLNERKLSPGMRVGVPSQLFEECDTCHELKIKQNLFGKICLHKGETCKSMDTGIKMIKGSTVP